MVSAAAAYLKARRAAGRAQDAISLPIINAIEGDSRPDYAHWGQSASWRGFALWLQTLTNQRLQFPGALNTAVSGTNTAQILARMPTSIAAAKAAGASAMWLMMGINDRIAGSFTFNDTMNNVTAIVKMVRAAGLVCFLYTDTTQGSAAFPAQAMSQSQKDIQKRTRYAYRQFHDPANDIYVFDLSPDFDDPLSTLNFNLNTMVADGTHHSVLGAYRAAMVALPTVQRRWQIQPFVTFTDNSQQYSANDNPFGCLTANPMVDGTTGNINASASNATGQVATGWSFGANAQGNTLAAALSKVAKADGTVWQQAVFSGQASAATTLTNYPLGTAQMWFYQNISLASAPIGSKVQVSAQIEWDAGNANISSILVGSEVGFSGGSTRNYSGYRGQTVAQPMSMIQGPQSLLVANEPIVVAAGATSHIMRIGIELDAGSVAAAMTFRFRGAGARRLA